MIQPSDRLEYVFNMSRLDALDLWLNCYEGEANKKHMYEFELARNKHTNFFQFEDSLFTSKPYFTRWGIKRKEEGDFIGSISYLRAKSFGIFYYPNNIGYSIGLDYTRKGYCTEALQSLLGYLHEEGVGLANAIALPRNIPSILCLQ
jgi:RimJ/RimL family protein N-acetyltransferase